jgi:TRAP-type C4-dicarboxylate transport system permease small subunit
MMARLLGLYGRSVDLLDRLTLWSCVVVFILVVGLNGFEIVSRYVFHHSSPYTVEASLSFSTFIYFAGYLVLLKRDKDVSMDFFHRRMPPRLRRVLDLVVAVAIVGFFAVLLDAAIRYYDLSSMMTHPVFPISQGITVIPIVLGAAGSLWVALYRALRALVAVLAPLHAPLRAVGPCLP